LNSFFKNRDIKITKVKFHVSMNVVLTSATNMKAGITVVSHYSISFIYFISKSLNSVIKS